MAELHIFDTINSKLVAFVSKKEKMDISIYELDDDGEQEYKACVYLDKQEAESLAAFIKQQFNL